MAGCDRRAVGACRVFIDGQEIPVVEDGSVEYAMAGETLETVEGVSGNAFTAKFMAGSINFVVVMTTDTPQVVFDCFDGAQRCGHTVELIGDAFGDIIAQDCIQMAQMAGPFSGGATCAMQFTSEKMSLIRRSAQ